VADSTRRGFLLMAGAGAAAVGAAAVVPKAVGTRAAVKSTVSGPLVAYVKDAKAGKVSLLIGEREVVVHDRELVARLANAAS
jgi:hypothetical protein